MYETIDQIKQANAHTGQRWFEEGAMQWFSSIIEPKVYQGCYFITSEKYELSDVEKGKGMPEMPRRWSIRLATPQGWISTMGEFQHYNSLQEAEEAVAKLPPCKDIVTEVRTTDHDVEVIVD